MVDRGVGGESSSGTTIREQGGSYKEEEQEEGGNAEEEKGGGGGEEKVEFGQAFQRAIGAHDWALAGRLVAGAGAAAGAPPPHLNDALCIALDSVWFLETQEELDAAVGLLCQLRDAGVDDFARATLRTAFLASCVSACRNHTASLADTVTIMAQRLRERLEECSGDELLKVEAAAKVQRFTKWALKCIGSHTRRRKRLCSRGGNSAAGGCLYGSSVESQLQLEAFKGFLELAAGRLGDKDYSEALDAACFPLTLFSNAIDPGWASSSAAITTCNMMCLLVQGGATNVNQCFLEAARFGSTQLVRILLQVANHRRIELDVNLGLGFAASYAKTETMECLVAEGNADAFLGPLMRAAERNSIPVVRWFVQRGCRDMELCLALTAAASNSQVEVCAYLLDHVPRPILLTLGGEILKAAGERTWRSLRGITFLLCADFLGSPDATYFTADDVSRCEDGAISPDLRDFLHSEWSEDAFLRGRFEARDHFVSVMRVLMKAPEDAPLRLWDLPSQLQVAIAYLPLYKECASFRGPLLSQYLRGQLVEAVLQLKGNTGNETHVLEADKNSLLTLLESELPEFVRARPKGGGDEI